MYVLEKARLGGRGRPLSRAASGSRDKSTASLNLPTVLPLLAPTKLLQASPVIN